MRPDLNIHDMRSISSFVAIAIFSYASLCRRMIEPPRAFAAETTAPTHLSGSLAAANENTARFHSVLKQAQEWRGGALRHPAIAE
jgi:hypothetical protein